MIVPGRHVDGALRRLLRGPQDAWPQYVAEAPTRVDPVFDDRPFFFAPAEALGPAASDARCVRLVLACC